MFLILSIQMWTFCCDLDHVAAKPYFVRVTLTVVYEICNVFMFGRLASYRQAQACSMFSPPAGNS